MTTRVAKLNATHPGEAILREAVQFLNQGEPIAFPTETVYGLGAHAGIDRAIELIYEIKGRTPDKPLPVMIANYAMLNLIAENISKDAQKLMQAFWPGPLTLVLHAKRSLSPLISGKTGTVAVRYPRHEVPIKMLQALNHPIVATSANLSENVPPQSAEDVMAQLNGRIPLILDAGKSEFGKESTILDCTGEKIKVLREGALTPDKLKPFLTW